jgi:hypothetical protein
VAQKIPPETEQILAPVQGIRHEASACTQLCYLLLTNHSYPGNLSFSESNSIIIKLISGE